MSFDHKKFLANVSSDAGVYQMFADEKILYVGKAKNLKKRLTSYFRGNISGKTKILVEQIARIEVIITNSETEALLLESSLIKRFKPRYNILLRDDKSYPYLYLSSGDFPRLSSYRGNKKLPGHFYGPFPSSSAVKSTLHFIYKTFKIRQCDDTYFKNRTRPCLQYQIKRCTAPCVNKISKNEYAKTIKNVQLFLEGKSAQLIKDLKLQMTEASDKQDYETAGLFRDQIHNLKQIQEKQYVVNAKGNTDVIAISQQQGKTCVAVMFIRDGRLLGQKPFYPETPNESSNSEILAAFIPQFYFNNNQTIPGEIILSERPNDDLLIQETLSNHANHKVTLNTPQKAIRKHWLQLAENNAHASLELKLKLSKESKLRFESLQELLNLTITPKRMDCFDISHSHGEATVASCVVFDLQGPSKKDYRRFNIKDITPGDDYAALHQAITRRYSKLAKEKYPDILLIDGGKNQLKQAIDVLEKLQITSIIPFSIAKGPSRKAGLETIYSANKAFALEPTAEAFHLLQHIRDEAHRFAITAHRKQRDFKRKHSFLETIPNVGEKRRDALLKKFKGIQELKLASIEEIAETPGINLALAKEIFDYLKE